jgi:2-polyprenyl-3-methyl-5-hydroxy-6-metoxy-1,4-benzoquinol methylase
VIETGTDADIVEQVALRALGHADAVLAICHPTSDRTRDILVEMNRRGLPLIVFDSPGPKAFDRARRLDFCRNVRRFFDPEALLWLGRREYLAAGSSDEALDPVHEVGLPGRVANALPRPPAAAPARQPWQRPRRRSRVRRRILQRADLAALDGLPREADGGEAGSALRLHSLYVVRARSRGRRAPFHIQQCSVPEQQVAERLSDLLRASAALLSEPQMRSPVPDGSGILGPGFHFDHLYVDYPPFRYLSDKFRPRSVLDIGCGVGAYLEGFKARGAAEVFGLDGFEGSGAVLCPDRYARHDLRQPLDLGCRFDLVVCTEVVEHIDREFEVTVLDSVRRHARGRILFSAARPGQPGTGHVNCRPAEHWLAYWRRTGWEISVFDTLAVRSLSTFFWFRRNLFVLQPHDGEPSEAGDSDIKSYEAEAVRWVAQPPAVHLYPLECPLAPLDRMDALAPPVG